MKRTAHRLRALRTEATNALARLLRERTDVVREEEDMHLNEIMFRLADVFPEGTLHFLPRQVRSNENIPLLVLRRFKRCCGGAGIFYVRFKHHGEPPREGYFQIGAFVAPSAAEAAPAVVSLLSDPGRALLFPGAAAAGSPVRIRSADLEQFGFSGPLLRARVHDEAAVRAPVDKPLQRVCAALPPSDLRLRSICARASRERLVNGSETQEELVRKMLAFGVGSVWKREFGFTNGIVEHTFGFSWDWKPPLDFLYVRASSNGQVAFLNDTHVEVVEVRGGALAYTCGEPVPMQRVWGGEPLAPARDLGGGRVLAHLQGLTEVQGERVLVCTTEGRVFGARNSVVDGAFEAELRPVRVGGRPQ